MVGCSCRVCTSSNPLDKRTRSSLLVQWAGKNVLIDTSTDLRRQALREKLTHIDAVLFTHSHADHIHGIDDLRGFHFLHKRVIPCYGDETTMGAISRKFSYIFGGMQHAGYAPLLEKNVVADTFTLFNEMITPVPLEHGSMPATGYRIRNMAYLTDCSHIPDSSRGLLKNLDLLILDALRYTPHANHFNIDGALEVVAELKPVRTILTHLTHEVPYSDRDRLPQGVDFGFDGMTLEQD